MLRDVCYNGDLGDLRPSPLLPLIVMADSNIPGNDGSLNEQVYTLVGLWLGVGDQVSPEMLYTS